MTKKEQVLSYLKDIRFWIIFFFFLRLYGITNPPLEVGHNWRQTDGLMIARNFYEVDANIFYPRVDVAGEKSGIVGSEFPILNYIIYVISLIVGYEHWLGRLVVLVTASIGILYFHKLIKRYFGESSAFNASIFVLVSFWFSYSRKIIPDAFAASLCIISLYYAFLYLDDGKIRDLLLFFILALLGCLSKIMVATILTVLVFPIFNTVIPLKRKILLSFFSLLILVNVCWWYFVWVPYLNDTYGFYQHFYMGTTFSEGLDAIFAHFGRVMKRFYDTPFKYTGCAALLLGIFLVIKNRQWLEFGIFMVPFVGFLVILVKTGAAIVGDSYYVITAIPAMAFIAGCGLANIPNARVVTAILVIVGIESIAAQIYDFRLREPYKSLAALETIMDTCSDRNDLIVINSGEHNPTAMYFAHRRGWSVSDPALLDSAFVNDIKAKGCKYAVLARKLYGDPQLHYQVLHESEYFKVYKLD